MVVSHSAGQITTVYMTDHFRLDKEAALAGIFILLLLPFARDTGLRAILSFADTILLMWKVLIPSLLNGLYHCHYIPQASDRPDNAGR